MGPQFISWYCQVRMADQQKELRAPSPPDSTLRNSISSNSNVMKQLFRTGSGYPGKIWGAEQKSGKYVNSKGLILNTRPGKTHHTLTIRPNGWPWLSHSSQPEMPHEVVMKSKWEGEGNTIHCSKFFNEWKGYKSKSSCMMHKSMGWPSSGYRVQL